MPEVCAFYQESTSLCEISSSHGGEYDVQESLMMEAVRTSESAVDNHFTRQYIPEDNSEHQPLCGPFFPKFDNVPFKWVCTDKT
jgi:hypothetical protein